MLKNPCPVCRSEREHIEAECEACGWSPEPPGDVYGCERCGSDVPTKQVAFHYNVGLLVMRFSGREDGCYCKGCIHGSFWRNTLITLLFGWWGIISFFVTPVFLVLNIVGYVPCFAMKTRWE